MAKKKGAKSAGLKFYHKIQTGPILSSFLRAKNYIFLNGFILALRKFLTFKVILDRGSALLYVTDTSVAGEANCW